jgi:hypothetical protein
LSFSPVFLSLFNSLPPSFFLPLSLTHALTHCLSHPHTLPLTLYSSHSLSFSVVLIKTKASFFPTFLTHSQKYFFELILFVLVTHFKRLLGKKSYLTTNI